jgi:hypothetical protein
MKNILNYGFLEMCKLKKQPRFRLQLYNISTTKMKPVDCTRNCKMWSVL